jgi:hypothetical protein
MVENFSPKQLVSAGKLRKKLLLGNANKNNAAQ